MHTDFSIKRELELEGIVGLRKKEWEALMNGPIVDEKGTCFYDEDAEFEAWSRLKDAEWELKEFIMRCNDED